MAASLFYSWAAGTGCEEEPERLARMTASQMEGDRVEALPDPAPDLDKSQA